MEKPEKETIRKALIAAALIFAAMLCRNIGRGLPGRFLALPRSFIYVGLFLYWGISVRRRVMQQQARRFLTAIAALMVFWISVRTVKYLFVSDPAVIRYLWYLYYLPMLMIPFLAVLVAASLGKPETYRLPNWTKTLYLPTFAPMVTWGTNPSMGVSFDQPFPEIRDMNDERAYNYMDMAPGQRVGDIEIGYVFIGSCTNARLSDLMLAAEFVKGKQIADNLTAIVVPGSRPVKQAAEALGLDKVFRDAGFEWRDPGCSMCLGMNPDKVPEGIHCASTSNRNFEDRQGFGAKTHLCSPAMAAAAAIYGRFVDVRELV